MKSAPDGIDQVKLPRAVVGLGENLDTVRWHGESACDVRCRVCGIVVGCLVPCQRPGVERKMMSLTDYHFWLHHFQAMHPELLPAEVRKEEAPGENPGPKANDETDTEAYPKAPPVSSTKG